MHSPSEASKRRGALSGVLALGLCVALLLGLCGCTPSVGSGGDPNDFAYAETAFSVSLRGTVTRLAPDGYTGAPELTGDTLTGEARTLVASVEVGEPCPCGLVCRERSVKITFHEPPALCGVTVVRQTSYTAPTDRAGATTAGANSHTQSVTVTHPGIPTGEHASPALAALVRFATPLFPLGDVVAATPVQDGAHTVTRRTADGWTIVYTFASDGILPIRIEATNGFEQFAYTVSP